MSAQLYNLPACKSKVVSIAQVQLPNTHKWVELNANNADKIDKYLAYDSATGAFTARVKDGVAPLVTDNYKVAVRVSTVVTHNLGKVLGEGLSTSWTFKVNVTKAPEDICKVEYLKAEWNTQAAETVSVNTGRRLQEAFLDESALDFALDAPIIDASLPTVTETATTAVTTTTAAVNVFPTKTQGTDIKNRTTLKNSVLEFYPGESFTLPKLTQVKNCKWAQTTQTTF